MVTRKAVRKDAITAERAHGTPDGTVVLQLVHADCQRRSQTALGMKVRASARP